MPTHVFQPSRNPPTWWDRLLVHPLDTTVAFISVVFGTIVILSALIPVFVPSKSIDKFPFWVAVAVAVFLVAGGLLAVIGLNWPGDEVDHGWALERFGWMLSSGGLITYALTVAYSYIGSVFSWGIPLMLGIGCVIRVISVQKIEETTRKDIAEVHGEQ